MNYSKINPQKMPFLYKALCILLVVCCVIIGLVGLILPVIPGFLFLFFAAILLARISTRFKSLLHNNPATAPWMKHWHSSQTLSVLQRAKLSFWVVARSLVSGVESAVNLLRRGDSNN
ncbi:MAG: DUF454 family protein [Pseudohongiella sp.]|nr:DUF454 family protein [Pseudohongiella sp.]